MQLRKVFPFAFVLLCSASTALAFNCTRLEYQELKDMSEQEIQEHYCKVERERAFAMKTTAPFDVVSACMSEVSRIMQIMERKNVKLPHCDK